MNYERNMKYFQPPDLVVPISLILIGLSLLVILSDAGKLIGIIIAGLGGFIAYRKKNGLPTDSEIDDICSREVESGLKRALEKLGVDEDEVKIIKPIQIEGYEHSRISSMVLNMQGKDMRWRASNYEAVILYFSEKQVYAYSYRFSLISNEKKESTDEYFYKDIVSISTSSDSITLKDSAGKDHIINFEEFRLTTSGGTSISCAMRDHGAIEKSIQGMKQLLREKKSA